MSFIPCRITSGMDDLLDALKKGKRGAVAKAITLVENNPVQSRRLIKSIFPHTGDSVIIGITGPAGAGKSSLIDKTVVALNRMGSKPAVLAVDPTSHITGGAILGDRVRMADSADSGTYIRSIASRGSTGAVSASLRNSIRVLEYAGFDPIIIESVGAGQTEVEISNIADITTVVFNPHTGDNIQAIKAGITEIGDLYVVNKSDLSGADRLYDAIRDYIADAITMATAADDDDDGDDGDDAPQSPSFVAVNNPRQGRHDTSDLVLKTSIKRSATITKFAKTLVRMSDEARSRKDDDKKRAKLCAELRDIVMMNLREQVDRILDDDKSVMRHLDRLVSGKSTPIEVGSRITKLLAKSHYV